MDHWVQGSAPAAHRAGDLISGTYYGMPDLFRDRFGEATEEFVTVFVVEPRRLGGVPIIVECARACGEPHLLHLRLPAQDKLRASGELDRHDPVAGGVIHFIGIE